MSKAKVKNKAKVHNIKSNKKYQEDIKIKIRIYLSDIENTIKDIESILSYSNDIIKEDPKELGNLKYRVIILVEAYMRLLHHILSHNHNVSVIGMISTIREAKKYKWINKKSFTVIKDLIEIRNSYLVHRYNTNKNKYCSDKKEEFINFLKKNIPILNNLSNQIRNKLDIKEDYYPDDLKL